MPAIFSYLSVSMDNEFKYMLASAPGVPLNPAPSKSNIPDITVIFDIPNNEIEISNVYICI